MTETEGFESAARAVAGQKGVSLSVACDFVKETDPRLYQAFLNERYGAPRQTQAGHIDEGAESRLHAETKLHDETLKLMSSLSTPGLIYSGKPHWGGRGSAVAAILAGASKPEQ